MTNTPKHALSDPSVKPENESAAKREESPPPAATNPVERELVMEQREADRKATRATDIKKH